MNRRGTVLIVVVVIVMLLSLAAYKYMLAMQTEHIAAAVVGDRLVARQAAFSARDLLAVLLETPRAERDGMGGLLDNLQLFGGATTALSESADSAQPGELAPMGLIAYPIRQSDEADFVGTSSMIRNDVDAADPRPGQTPQLGLGKLTRYGAVNESSKLHLFRLLEYELNEPGSAVAKLMLLPGMDEATAGALLDWIDPDDEQRPNGAESDFYAMLSRPLVPRNALPLDLDELLFVKGITPQRLFGTWVALPNDVAPGMPMPRLEIAGEKSCPWVDLLTVYSAERNETYTGQSRIFVNGEDLSQLYQNLVEVIPSEWATFIVLYRQFGPSTVSAQTDKTNQVTIDFSSPAAYEIESPLDLIGMSVTLTDDTDEEVTIESPFHDDLASMQSQLPQFLEAITLVPETRIIGRINVNEAPVEVLSTLPGLDSETVDSIIAARQSAAIDASSRSHPVWLLTEGLVNRETMRAILPQVTCGGDVYRASVWGRVDDASPMFHFETVLDASEGRTRSVYYRELAAPRKEIEIPTAETLSGSPSVGADPITTLGRQSNRTRRDSPSPSPK